MFALRINDDEISSSVVPSITDSNEKPLFIFGINQVWISLWCGLAATPLPSIHHKCRPGTVCANRMVVPVLFKAKGHNVRCFLKLLEMGTQSNDTFILTLVHLKLGLREVFTANGFLKCFRGCVVLSQNHFLCNAVLPERLKTILSNPPNSLQLLVGEICS